ncbi:DinB family protein, partial [Paraburkholderia sp. EG304]|uniref:DinB family protein n=1 Tax=Paraburkholderia sp. EG304 TaxID=3237015 RepID=UPI00397D3AD7
SPDMPRPQAGIPESVSLFPEWDGMKRERTAFDDVMIAWSDRLEPAALDGDLNWFSGALQRDVTKPRWVLVAHMFNHGTHHRGQVHCMLTQAGGKPHATDLQALPE